MLKKLKNKMYQYIDKYGLCSEKTLTISQQIDKEINNYYSSNMKYYYKQSIQGLQNYFNIYRDLPNKSNWNEYAFQNNFLSSKSIEYISCKTFNSWCRDSYKKFKFDSKF